MLAAVIFCETRAMKVTAAYARVGPTTFPYVIAAGLAVLAVGTALSAWRGGFPEREPEHARPDPLDRRRPRAAAPAAEGRRLLDRHRRCSSRFTARGFGRGPLWLTIPIGIVFALVVWLVFARLLQLSLPAGPLERLIP